jgi:hypothetical protein
MFNNGRLDAFLKRVVALLIRATKARLAARSRQMDRILLAVAVVVFIVGVVFSYVSLPDFTRAPVWGLMALVALVGVPLTLAANTAEYVLSVRLLGYRISLEPAIRVSLLAAAANLLPIPGSVLVRTQAMRGLGAKTGRALATSTLVGVAWLATGAALTGGFLFVHGRLAAGAVTVIVGLILLGATLFLSARLDPARAVTISAQLLVVEAASVLVKAARLYVILHALHYQVGMDQAMALTMAAVVSTASGFFPGGLGATELLSAAVSPLVGIPAAVGLLAAAIDRLIQLTLLGLLSGALLRRSPWTAKDVNGTRESSEVMGNQPQTRA